MTDQEKLIDKLKKLKAMATSAEKVGNEEEAQAFAAMVQTLLAKHKLNASDIEWEQQQQENIIHLQVYPGGKAKSKGQTWEQLLAVIVGKSCSCRVMIHRGYNLITFVGIQQDAEAAKDAFEYLHAAASHLAEREYVSYFYKCRKAGDVTRARGYKASWLYGFVQRLSRRYQENEERLKSQCAGTALIRLTDALTRVDNSLANMQKREIKQTPVENSRGFLDGQRAADKTHLASDPERRLV